MRRIAEIPGDGAKYVTEHLRETMLAEERIRQAEARDKAIKQIEGLKIGGLVNIGVGVGLMIFLYCMHLDDKGAPQAIYLVGLIPGLIGVALLGYALFFAPKPNPS